MTDRRSILLSAASAAGLGAFGIGRVAAQPAADQRLLQIAFNQEPDSVDLTASRSPTTSRGILENVTEALVGLSNDGQIVPTVANWRVMSDARVIEFQLKPGIKFHSGDPLTAADIEFSHQRMMRISPRYRNTQRYLDRVEVLNEKTIRFFFREPSLQFLTARPLLVASKAYFTREGEEAAARQPVGTGPYRFTGRVLGQSIDLEPWDGFRDGRPKGGKVRFRIVKEDTTRVAMLRAGEVDMVVGVPYSLADGLDSAKMRVVRQEIPQTVTLQYNFANPKAPWTDLRVRRAMASAIDANAIAKSLMRGGVARHTRLAPGDLGHDATLPPYKYDPALAKKLLAEAGFARGFDFPVNYWANATPGIKETAEAVVLYLKAVGINARLDGKDAVAMAEFVRNNRNDANASFGLVAPIAIANQVDPAEWLAYYLGSKNGLAVYRNDAFDQAIEKAVSVADSNERAGLTRAAVRIAHEDVSDIPLWTTVLVYAMQPGIEFVPVKKSLYSVNLLNVKRRSAG